MRGVAARELHGHDFGPSGSSDGAERRITWIDEGAGHFRQRLAIVFEAAIDHDPILAPAFRGIRAGDGPRRVPACSATPSSRPDQAPTGFRLGAVGAANGPATASRCVRPAIVRRAARFSGIGHEASTRVEPVAEGEVPDALVRARLDRTIGGVGAGEVDGHRADLVQAHRAVAADDELELVLTGGSAPVRCCPDPARPGTPSETARREQGPAYRVPYCSASFPDTACARR